ncbi:E3 ubiquitin-protein ligase SINAT3 [Capsicum baccatum]|uniref:E3 ubiquitin-protein ligase SINAT3 n=1 Tax=Capsicum baccatum TaxID=33114 RepID=A0A2G2XN79_CAPBA|nr:E3 ubiquitin-protein ligase SINAT3 [Capsicum baccatum]
MASRHSKYLLEVVKQVGSLFGGAVVDDKTTTLVDGGILHSCMVFSTISITSSTCTLRLSTFEAFNLGLAPVYIEFIRFIGADDDEIRFWDSLEVGGFDRKLTWQGVPRSIHDSHKLVRDSLNGLIIHRSMTLFFSGGDMKELKL